MTFVWNGHLTKSDANLVGGPTVSIAHGEWRCGFEGANTPPLYPLLAAGYATATDPGHGTPFPAVGARESCSHASDELANWLAVTQADKQLVDAGLLVWPVLLAGFVGLLRAAKRGRTNLEVVGVCVLGLTPQVGYCLNVYFHPGEVLALGLGLAAIALALTDRWALGGATAGLSLSAHQLGLLVVLVLLLIAPRVAYRRLVPACVLTVLVVCLPVAVLTQGGAISGMVFDGITTLHSGSLVSGLGFRGFPLAAVSRGIPLAGTIALGLLFRRSLGSATACAVVAMTLLAWGSLLRLTFEVAIFANYLAWSAVALLALDLVAGRLRAITLGWIAGTAILYAPFPSSFYPFSQDHPAAAQTLMVVTGLGLVVVQVRGLLKDRSEQDERVQPEGLVASRPNEAAPDVLSPTGGAPR